MNPLIFARIKAHQIREAVESSTRTKLYGQSLLDTIIEMEDDLECKEVRQDDPLLGNSDGYDKGRFYAEYDLIVISESLSDTGLKNHIKAHELGHYFLHLRTNSCAINDIDSEETVLALPYAEGRIASYHPKQAQENEATIFANELLIPSNRLARLFDGGKNASELAAIFEVPLHIIHSQMASVLLAPPVNFDRLAEAEGIKKPVFHWTELNSSQKQACCHYDKPALVDAGPGTGKTRTLTSRVEWLIKNNRIAPEKLLVLTFSNKATYELRERLRQTLPKLAHLVATETFHGFGLEFLKKYAGYADLPQDFRVIDPIEAEILFTENLSSLELLHFSNPITPGQMIPSIQKEIGRAKESLVSPAEYLALVARMEQNEQASQDKIEKSKEIAHAYGIYQNLLRENGLVDFGDLVMLPVKILNENPILLEQLRLQHTHILVDEYQDINQANGELIGLLAVNSGKNLWAVGDLRQSIYRFRGASPTYLRQFKQQYPQADLFSLEGNYRSSELIVNLARLSANQMNIDCAPATWTPAKKSELPTTISVAWATNKSAELRGVGEKIKAFLSSGHSYRDIAVLCRTNPQISELAHALSLQGIPTLHLGKFLFRSEIKTLLSVLSASTSASEISWIRLGDCLTKPISQEQAATFWRLALETSPPNSIFEIMHNDTSLALSKCQKADIKRLQSIFQGSWDGSQEKPWSILASFLFEYGTYLRTIRAGVSEESAIPLLAIGQFLNLAGAFGKKQITAKEQGITSAFLQYVRHLINRDEAVFNLPVAELDIDAVRIMTIHKSKGLEFPIVFIPNLAKGRFPASMRGQPIYAEGLEQHHEDNSAILEEESCLFVGITRAQNHLVLSRALSYASRKGKPTKSTPSPLWKVVEQPLQALGVPIPSERWDSSEPFESVTNPLSADYKAAKPRLDNTIDIRAIRIFERCSMQYYYRYILGLAVKDTRDIYLQFHQSLHHSVKWLELESQKGKQHSLDETFSHFAGEFARHVAEDHVHYKWYLQKALRMLDVLWSQFCQSEEISENAKYRVLSRFEIENTQVKFYMDKVVDESGHKSVTRFKTGKVPNTIKSDLYTMLYRKAAEEQLGTKVSIFHSYLETGDVVEVPNKNDAAEFTKLHDAINHISAHTFKPTPKDSRYWQVCSSCSFYNICPKEGK